MGRILHTKSDAATVGPETYAKWRESDLGRITEEIEMSLITELIGDVKNKRILDVGCGDGALAIRLAQQGANVIGIDTSSDMIQAAKYRACLNHVDVQFLVADARAIPFSDVQFDVVSAVTVLCFIPDASPMIAEVSRVLRPSGRLVIGELGRLSIWAARRRVRAWLGSLLWRQGRFRTASELRKLARGAGLIPIDVRGAIYYPHSDTAARWMSRWDSVMSRLTTFGAAFIALSAKKGNR